jgi:hypothetical protein
VLNRFDDEMPNMVLLAVSLSLFAFDIIVDAGIVAAVVADVVVLVVGGISDAS